MVFNNKFSLEIQFQCDNSFKQLISDLFRYVASKSSQVNFLDMNQFKISIKQNQKIK